MRPQVNNASPCSRSKPAGDRFYAPLAGDTAVREGPITVDLREFHHDTERRDRTVSCLAARVFAAVIARGLTEARWAPTQRRRLGAFADDLKRYACDTRHVPETLRDARTVLDIEGLLRRANLSTQVNLTALSAARGQCEQAFPVALIHADRAVSAWRNARNVESGPAEPLEGPTYLRVAAAVLAGAAAAGPHDAEAVRDELTTPGDMRQHLSAALAASVPHGARICHICERYFDGSPPQPGPAWDAMLHLVGLATSLRGPLVSVIDAAWRG